MAEGSQSEATPGSNISKTPAVKDKECSFCHQAFTSSSLGRHLDLYIKGKNPKPPDDVHNVEEIRKLRGNITRRLPRHPGQREGSITSSANATPSREDCSPLVARTTTGEAHVDSEPLKALVNKASWQATGVINDLPQMPRNNPSIWATRRQHRPTTDLKQELGQNQAHTLLDVDDRSQAAELALKEVLESVKASTVRAQPPAPFDFNLFSLSLPQMYLQCLGPPPALLAEPASRPHGLSWSTSPPSTRHCELLRGWLSNKLCDWRRRLQQSCFGDMYLHDSMNGHAYPRSEADAIREEEVSYYEHLENAQQSWTKLAHKERMENWQFECAKAFAREQEKHQATKRRLDEAEHEIQVLRARLDRIAQDQQLLDRFGCNSTVLSLSHRAVSHFPPHADWDYNSLISKWRIRLQSARDSQRSLSHLSRNLSPPNSILLQANGNGHSPAHQHDQSSPCHFQEPNGHGDGDEELADALGEADPDEGFNVNQPIALGKGVISPHLRTSREIGRLSRKRRRSIDAG